jgi:ABC-type uncharacterized transport system permease subunit
MKRGSASVCEGSTITTWVPPCRRTSSRRITRVSWILIVDQSQLRQKDYVFALRSSGAEKAWPLRLFEGGAVINDRAGMLDIVLIGDAAFAAFCSVVPGFDRRMLLLPLGPLALWIASVGHGCVQDWLQFGAGGELAAHFAV